MIQDSEKVIDAGDGVPRAPAVTVGIADGSVNGSPVPDPKPSGGSPLSTPSGLTVDLILEFLRFPVSHGVHDCLHTGTKCPLP